MYARKQRDRQDPAAQRKSPRARDPAFFFNLPVTDYVDLNEDNVWKSYVGDPNGKFSFMAVSFNESN